MIFTKKEHPCIYQKTPVCPSFPKNNTLIKWTNRTLRQDTASLRINRATYTPHLRTTLFQPLRPTLSNHFSSNSIYCRFTDFRYISITLRFRFTFLWALITTGRIVRLSCHAECCMPWWQCRIPYVLHSGTSIPEPPFRDLHFVRIWRGCK